MDMDGDALAVVRQKREFEKVPRRDGHYPVIGPGCDIYLEYFKLSPELKFCVGFNDMIERDRPNLENEADIKYTNAIDRLLSRLLILSFNFE